MEEEKNTKLVVILVLSIVLTILSAGYIVYDKFIAEDKSVDTKCNDTKDSKTAILEYKDFVGKYSYEGEFAKLFDNEGEYIGSGEPIVTTLSDANMGKMAVESLELDASGIAYAKALNKGSDAYEATGKWYISDNKIIIINTNCEPQSSIDSEEVEYPNCEPIWYYEYKVENNKLTLSSENNTMAKVELTK